MVRSSSGGRTTAFRLPPQTEAGVDAYARQLESQSPGREVTRSEAIRLLLAEALAAHGAGTKTVSK